MASRRIIVMALALCLIFVQKASAGSATGNVTVTIDQSIGITLSFGESAVTSTSFFNYICIVLSLTAGTALTMWIGERINEKGIGNGMSLLIFAGIISRFPMIIYDAAMNLSLGAMTIWVLLIAIVVILFLIN